MLIRGQYRCINCFSKLNSEDEKCSCGFDEAQYRVAPHCLKPGTILSDIFFIGRVIGEGGFGITYVGYDMNLELRVAIKEFYLNGFNTRNNTVSDEISASYGDVQNLVDTNKAKFINEARILAKFNSDDGIVTVHHFIYLNNTAYIIMEYVDGYDLKEYLKRNNQLSLDEVITIFIPIMRTLDKVHGMNLIHRDISPDNIIFTTNEKVKLLDFGAAREASDGNRSLSVVLKHGFAPPEQYQSHGKQGPWTDVYALSATIYKCLTGKTPVEAVDRTMGEEVEPIYKLTDSISKEISDVIMKGLELSITKRYQTMGEFADTLKSAYDSEKNSNSIAVLPKDSDKSEDETKEKDEKIVRDNNLTEENKGYIDEEDSRELIQKEIGKVEAQTEAGNDKDSSSFEDFRNAEIGDRIIFGNYKDYNNKWRVLKKENKTLTLISDGIIAQNSYNITNTECTWNTSSLKKWLNEEYYNEAFSEKEKAVIMNGGQVGIPGGVSLLTLYEVKALFENLNERVCYYEGEAKSWWIQSPNDSFDKQYYASTVSYDGRVCFNSVNHKNVGVRPTITIKINN